MSQDGHKTNKRKEENDKSEIKRLVKKLLERNLIKNSCGDDAYLYWCFLKREKKFENFHLLKSFLGKRNLMDYYKNNSNIEDHIPEVIGWKVEEHTCDLKQKTFHNFATSYFNGQRFQVIDLYDEGINKIILNNLKPKIEISEYYAGGLDFSSEYQIWVALLNENFEQVDFFTFSDQIPQWSDHEWHKVSHVFQNYPDNVRYIVYYNYGRDTQSWTGFNGIKITKSSVKILSN